MLSGLPAVQAAEGAAQAYQEANSAYVSLSRDAAKRKNRANWIKTINLYAQVSKNYPDSNVAPKAMFKQAKLYEQLYGYSSRRSDLQAAISLYTRLAARYPQSSLADDGLYRSARIYDQKMGDKQSAYDLYRQVIEKFPHGDMAQQAREGMNAIHIKQAEPQVVQSSGGLVEVQSVRKWTTEDYTRIVIDLGRDTSFNSFSLPANAEHNKPPRLVVDINNARTKPGLPYKMNVNEGILKCVRVSQNQKDKVRVVMDLTEGTNYNAFPLSNPSRLVVDVRGNGPMVASVDPKAGSGNGIKKVRSGVPSTMPDDVASIAKQLSLKISTIVIDPGHGGKDPGAIGRGGIKEKELTLEISKRLAKQLRGEGFTVYLTRESDIFVPLEERTAFANKKNADLFISIHMNSNRDKKVRGIEAYYLNLTTDESAIEVAARENATTSRSLGDLQLILNDLMLNAKINESSRLAGSLQGSVMQSVKNIGYGGRDRGVRQAPFYVLLGAQMPSVLLELGFLSNSQDFALLKKDSYQQTLADGIADGIHAYMKSTGYAYVGGDL